MPCDYAAIPYRRTTMALAVVLLASIAGCNGKAPEAPGQAVAAAEEAKPAARRSRSEEDRGNASFVVAGAQWTGERASARVKDGNLRISASHTTRVGDAMNRDSLELAIKDYKGPGTYKANMSSMFVRVSITMPKEGGSEADATKLLVDAIGDAGNIRLANADVEISAASDGYIDGRFSLDTPGMPDKSVTAGQFHARVRE